MGGLKQGLVGGDRVLAAFHAWPQPSVMRRCLPREGAWNMPVRRVFGARQGAGGLDAKLGALPHCARIRREPCITKGGVGGREGEASKRNGQAPHAELGKRSDQGVAAKTAGLRTSLLPNTSSNLANASTTPARHACVHHPPHSAAIGYSPWPRPLPIALHGSLLSPPVRFCPAMKRQSTAAAVLISAPMLRSHGRNSMATCI